MHWALLKTIINCFNIKIEGLNYSLKICLGIEKLFVDLEKDWILRS